MRRVVLLLLAPIALRSADAQRRPAEAAARNTPKWWGSVSAGYFTGPLIHDAATSSTWDFDTGLNWRVSLERAFAPTLTAGVAWTTSRIPLSYSAPGVCTRCNADATVSTYAAIGRYATSPRRFHQIVELALGVVRYDAFDRLTPQQALAPTKGNSDFMFGAGGGLGYAIARDWQLALMQDWNMSFHERPPDGVGGGRTSRTRTSRVTLRIGF